MSWTEAQGRYPEAWLYALMATPARKLGGDLPALVGWVLADYATPRAGEVDIDESVIIEAIGGATGPAVRKAMRALIAAGWLAESGASGYRLTLPEAEA
jgi:hypothetical protein